MNKKRIGTYDRETYLHTFEVGPFEAVELEPGMDNIALVDGDFSDCQIITDGRAHRLKMGQSLPANGRLRYVRNPYSQTAEITLAFGQPTELNAYSFATSIRHMEKQRSYISINVPEAPGPGIKRGVLFMAENSTWDISGITNWNHSAFIIPKAKLAYMDTMPATIDQVGTAYYRNGGAASDIVCRYGTYTDADMAAWIAAANWTEQLAQVTQEFNKAEAILSPDTALIVNSGEDNSLIFHADILELGNWNPEARG